MRASIPSAHKHRTQKAQRTLMHHRASRNNVVQGYKKVTASAHIT